MLKPIIAALSSLFVASAAALPEPDPDSPPLRLAVVGLVHGHVEGVLWAARDREDLQIVGVHEPDRDLFDRMAAKYGLDASLWWDDLPAMLDETMPEAATVMTSTRVHLEAVEACAPRGIHAMVEKPLAVSVEHAERMAELAAEHGVHVLTNYETSWYASVREAYRLTRPGGGYFTPIRRAVFRHGHRGPQEIGVGPGFLEWLIDPEENGAGALYDFGCYGANIMTWLLDGEPPISVTASVSTLKPDLYPRVDDDATIILTYPATTAVIQASWAWTHDNKEMDLHTEAGSIHAAKWDEIALRRPDGPRRTATPGAIPQPYDDPWRYFKAVVRGEAEVDGLASLENNVLVVRILEAAKKSAEQGAPVRLNFDSPTEAE